MKLEREDGLEGGVELRKIICGMIIVLLILGVFPLAFNVQLVKAASGTIYIKADGSVDPSSAPILNVGNEYYTFTANISGSIVVERDNVVVYGAGYALEGAGTGNGISLTGRSNVTLTNTTIREFYHGVYLDRSSGNTLYTNTITDNAGGISLYYSSGNSISANTITNSTYNDIYLYSSSGNSISANTITNSTHHGIYLYSSSNNNSISANTITNNAGGIYLDCSSGNGISANTITNNYESIHLLSSSGNGISANTITNTVYSILLSKSSGNSMSANTITNNDNGIYIYSSSPNNSVSANTITNSTYFGIRLYSSSNSICANTITNSNDGIILDHSSSSNSISANTITNNTVGIYLLSSSSNLVCHNNFVGNTVQAIVDPLGYVNVWDDGYPSGGNYWSDYAGVDLYKGPNQDVAGIDEIGDTPYTINVDNIDHYPLLNPYVALTNVTSLVVRGGDNRVWYRTYSSSVWGSWIPIASATGDSLGAAMIGNNLHIVARNLAGAQIWHGYVNLATNVFSGWTLISGSPVSAPTLASNGTHLSLVVRGSDSKVWYRTYSSFGGWGSWYPIASATGDSLGAAMIGNNLHIVARDMSGTTIWHSYVDVTTNAFSGWTLISGKPISKPTLTS